MIQTHCLYKENTMIYVFFTLPSWIATTSGRPPTTRARSVQEEGLEKMPIIIRHHANHFSCWHAVCQSGKQESRGEPTVHLLNLKYSINKYNTLKLLAWQKSQKSLLWNFQKTSFLFVQNPLLLICLPTFLERCWLKAKYASALSSDVPHRTLCCDGKIMRP